MRLCIFGYECPQIASGQGEKREEEWQERESDKVVSPTAQFLLSSPFLYGEADPRCEAQVPQLAGSLLCPTCQGKDQDI